MIYSSFTVFSVAKWFSYTYVCVWKSRSVVFDSLWPHGLLHGQYTGVGSLSILQGIVPTQGSNPGLPHCRQILYQLSSKGSSRILCIHYIYIYSVCVCSFSNSFPLNILTRYWIQFPVLCSRFLLFMYFIYSNVVHLPSCVQLFTTAWTAACQGSLSLTISQSFPKFMFIELVMPSNHLILPLLPSSLFSYAVICRD